MNEASESNITARQAEAHVPLLRDFCGNDDIRAHFERILLKPVGSDGNILIEGVPGTGKTNIALSYLRELFQNPTFYAGDLEAYRLENPNHAKRPDEIRLFQSCIPGKLLVYTMVHGATDTRATIESKLNDLLFEVKAVHHKYVVLDESGELFFRGLEEPFRAVQQSDDVTVIATAQNFHAKRKTDSKLEEEDRLRAFRRRFPQSFTTSNPTDKNHLLYLIRKMQEWNLTLDDPSTLRLLVRKAKGVVGYTVRQLIRTIDRPERRLTREDVEQADVDPITR